MRFCGRSLPCLWWYNPLVYIIRAWSKMYTNKMRERDWNMRFRGNVIAHRTTLMNKECPDYSQTGGERWSVWHSHHWNSKGWRETRTKLSSFVCYSLFIIACVPLFIIFSLDELYDPLSHKNMLLNLWGNRQMDHIWAIWTVDQMGYHHCLPCYLIYKNLLDWIIGSSHLDETTVLMILFHFLVEKVQPNTFL